MKIGLTYNLKETLSSGTGVHPEAQEEFDNPQTIDALCEIFSKNGYETARLGSGIDITERLRNDKVDFVFNISEGHHGRNRESHLPSIFEFLGIPYSGSDPLTLGMTLDKTIMKKMAFYAGIPSPRYRVVTVPDDIEAIDGKLSYPLISKPAWEGSSKGVYESSKVFDKSALHKSIMHLLTIYPNQPVLVEEYIEGREITVGVIGNNPPRVLGLMEIVNKKDPEKDIFYCMETKRDWESMVDYASPPNINRVLDKHIKDYALMAFGEFGCRDISRIDFRVSKHEKPYLLDINPLPGLSPQYGDLVIMARMQGINYEELILSILNHALLRNKKDGVRQ